MNIQKLYLISTKTVTSPKIPHVYGLSFFRAVERIAEVFAHPSCPYEGM